MCELSPSQNQALRINKDRLMKRLFDLGQFGKRTDGGVNRLALTDADGEGRNWTVANMKQLGLAVTIDAIGNGIGILPGIDPDKLPVMMGSHIDTVQAGGLYDGCLGVMAALEVIETLVEAGIRTRRPLAAAFFTNEEGARFSPDMMGSLVYVGGLPLDDALAIRGIDGTSVGEELKRIGYAGNTPAGTPQIDSYVELHIEQGPVLDREHCTIGVVEGVQGISWHEFTLQGTSNHAGTTPMALRHDAGLVAARVAVFSRELTHRMGSGQLATVGALKLAPSLVNVVPGHATFTVDLRNTDDEQLTIAERELLDFATQAAAEEGVTLTHKQLARFSPVAFDPLVVNLIEQHARALNVSARRMPSGAGHDAQMLARICPAGMIFVPSHDGISHNPREYTSPDDLATGAQLLLNVVLELANRP